MYNGILVNLQVHRKAIGFFLYRNCNLALNGNIKLINVMLSIGQLRHIKRIKPKHLKNLDILNEQHKLIFQGAIRTRLTIKH